MTQRLYEQDSFCREFTATVLSCERQGETYSVILDRTAFFPEGGGQAADRGMLGGAEVLDAQMVDGEIIHILKAPLTAGRTVTGVLDWDTRFLRMQKHTGEHIVCGIIHRLYGYENVGFHLGSEDVTLDLNGELTREQLDKVEEIANRVVSENRSVTAEYPSADDLATMEYRSKKDIDGDVRIVTIEGLDRCACCAPHVAMTGQVGLIKLLDFIRYKGGIRIHMQCGLDALRDYRMRYTQTAAIAATLSVKQHAVLDGIERLIAQRDALTRELAAVRKELCALRVEMLCADSGRALFIEKPMDGESLRDLALAASAKVGGLCAAFAGDDESGYNYAASGGNLSDFAATLKERLNARGGGSAQLIQGRVFTTSAEITAFWNAL